MRRLVRGVEASLGGRRAVDAATMDHICARARLTLAAASRCRRARSGIAWSDIARSVIGRTDASSAASCVRLERLSAVLLVQPRLADHGLPRRVARGLGGRRTLNEGGALGHGALPELVGKRDALLPQ